MPTTIRAYRPDDLTAVLLLFDSNTPDFFALAERSDFAAFLAEPRATLLVVESSPARTVIGFGGYYVQSDERAGGLAWGMISREWHRKGIGRRLLHARLTGLRRAGVERVRVRTSQRSRGFFERLGFVAVGEPTPNGFAPGIDLVELWLSLEAE